jgi:hypothetical protein
VADLELEENTGQKLLREKINPFIVAQKKWYGRKDE